jgi:hypothetical protein
MVRDPAAARVRARAPRSSHASSAADLPAALCLA